MIKKITTILFSAKFYLLHLNDFSSADMVIHSRDVETFSVTQLSSSRPKYKLILRQVWKQMYDDMIFTYDEE